MRLVALEGVPTVIISTTDMTAGADGPIAWIGNSLCREQSKRKRPAQASRVSQTSYSGEHAAKICRKLPEPGEG